MGDTETRGRGEGEKRGGRKKPEGRKQKAADGERGDEETGGAAELRGRSGHEPARPVPRRPDRGRDWGRHKATERGAVAWAEEMSP